MQTSYSQDPVAGLNGQVADGRPHDIMTRVAESACGVGRFVVGGTAQLTAKHPSATWASTPEKALGLVILDPSRVTPDYSANEGMAILKQGTMWVTFEPDTTPTVDSPVFARITANGAGKLLLGALRANADTANAIQVTGAYFRKIVGTVALVEIDLP